LRTGNGKKKIGFMGMPEIEIFFVPNPRKFSRFGEKKAS